ncbi:putative surface protein with fasciclin (FAS1) repeats [Murinocardiopsis flavida]|uniref:Putative surface protein with fasciclin (FAS1) repeats n=1 Tax=Murinocardiopsis flavida TaxID=645275 RepID=A0A2P8CPM2_9ACTN|nr:fasciclin domain-containing protein [Murinocardiopsis flavida]PSK86916.1 putative surface protein with fasciclin (FAS1) repeats [Murinocardiopsis flavida]
MTASTAQKLMLIPAAATLAFGLAACGGGGSEGGGEKDASPAADKSSEADGGKAAMDEPFGPACADVPADGAGSFDGMAQDPVATAAGNNPELSTLVDAVGKAELGDTLNSAEDITVFAPANAAFEKVPEKDLNALLDDKEMLTEVLTYHVVEGKQTPADLEKGDFTSLQGEKVATSGSGEDFKVNDEASVACGNVQTSNATVYIIDSVLMPPEK